MVTPKSIKLFKEAKKVMVGGVNSPVRSFMSVGGNPLVIQSGRGSKIVDVDGNGYTDYCLAWGALILGHAHKDVMAAVTKALRSGTSFGATTKAEIDIAQFIVKHVPSIDMVRFVNSGTEATMSAIRVARGYTKKNMIVKFDGCYHGHFDDLLTKAGSGVAVLKESSSLGITPNHIHDTLSLPYNNVSVLAETLAHYKDNIACVILEPVAGNMGVIPATKEFLRALRDLTKKYNIVLIFDEVMSGFRSSLGCVQGDVGIIPDMTCLGKIIGGGFPVGAYGGRRDIMKCLAPEGGVYQAGTFSGSPVVMAAGLATLKNLNDSFYQNLNKRVDKFVLSVNNDFCKNKLNCWLSSYKSMASIWFGNDPVMNYSDVLKASSKQRYSQLFQYLLRKGVYWPPAELETFFISGAHSQKDLDYLRESLAYYFNEIEAKP